MTYDYFYGQQAEMFAFYRVPKVLFTEDCFWNVSTDAKLLYGILLDRMNLSARNGWLDEEGRVYIIFTIEEIKGALGCAEKKAVKLLDELEKKCGLIERKRQGLGKPNLIYVKNFISGSVERQFLNCQKDNSGVVKNTIQELSKAQGNNTDTNYIDFSDTDPFFPSGFCGKEVDETDEFTRYYQYFYEQLSIERTRDYTVMSNHHLRDKALSLKSKGLLSMMLSLPEDWNYTTRGLAKICKEGVDAIGGALRELEAAGYIVRHQMRDRQGRISDTEYVIYEQPQPKAPDTPQPDTASPDTENPYLDSPDTEKPAELNIEKSKTQKSNTQGASTDSIPFRETAAARPPERKGRDAMSVEEMQSYRDLVLENIEYDHLCREFATYREDLDEIVELIVETVCARRKTTRIAGADFPHEVVRSRFLKLDSSHIEFVMECLHNNTTEVRNMKQYLLTVLFNAPTTMNNHYTAQVNHDMHAGGW